MHSYKGTRSIFDFFSSFFSKFSNFFFQYSYFFFQYRPLFVTDEAFFFLQSGQLVHSYKGTRGIFFNLFFFTFFQFFKKISSIFVVFFFQCRLLLLTNVALFPHRVANSCTAIRAQGAFSRCAGTLGATKWGRLSATAVSLCWTSGNKLPEPPV